MTDYNIDHEIEEGLKRSEEMLKKQRVTRLITTMIVVVLALLGFAVIGGVAYLMGSRSVIVPTPAKYIIIATVTPVPSLTTSPVPTKTKTPQPTETKKPTNTATRTPTLPGPIIISDNFESNLANWKNCDQCQIKDGTLVLGPYPSVNSAKAYPIICIPCGKVEHYEMSVDTWYESGASDRGFGFLIRMLDNGTFTDLEITTWQDYGIWEYNPENGDRWDAWTSSAGGWQSKGYVRAGRLHNHLEVSFTKVDNQWDLLTIFINDHEVRKAYIPVGDGNVGLIVGLHSLAVAFDNFIFEELVP